MRVAPVSLTLIAVGLLACGKPEQSASDSATSAPAAPSAMAGDSAAMAHPDTLVDRVRADLASLQAATGDDIKTLVPAHSAVVESLIADCEKMMSDMKMKVPAAWTTAVAAMRADLSAMRSASAASIRTMLPSHIDRVNAMLTMRHDMMKM